MYCSTCCQIVHPFGCQNTIPRRFVLQMEEVELPPEPAVIALFGFLDPRDVRGKVVLVRPRGPVDPLQHLVARIAAPVRALRPSSA
jgi:hypothetical protein